MSDSRVRSWVLAWTLCSIAASAALAKGSTSKLPDKGLLDPAWFGPGIEFHATEDIDFLWVKPEFTVKGHKILVDAWQDPDMLEKGRDAKDSAKASELTALMPSRIRGALTATLGGVAEASKDDGDVVITGRVVDCNAGNKAAKFWVGFGAGSGSVTFDIKITDKASGELLVGIHHRVISGTLMSEIDDKVAKWLEVFGNALKNGFATPAPANPPARD
jgi:hypothetical protein